MDSGPSHCSKLNITIKKVAQSFGFPEHIKGILYYSLLSVQWPYHQKETKQNPTTNNTGIPQCTCFNRKKKKKTLLLKNANRLYFF